MRGIRERKTVSDKRKPRETPECRRVSERDKITRRRETECSRGDDDDDEEALMNIHLSKEVKYLLYKVLGG